VNWGSHFKCRAKLSFCLTVVVVACEAAIQLELTRRENDRKVIALKAEMLDMMEVLLECVTWTCGGRLVDLTALLVTA